MSLVYSADVEEGSAHFYVMRVQRFPVQVDTVWSHTIKASGEHEITVPIPQSGRHQVGVKLGHFQGDVDLRWRRIRSGND